MRGCWASKVAERVGKLHCIEASSDALALAVAKRNLTGLNNVELHRASVDEIPLADDSMDFGYSLGVLHHIPDTADGINACVIKLKPGAPFLVNLYYAFDNRPAWFRTAWKVSEVFRSLISSFPFGLNKTVTDLIAVLIYFPLAKMSLVLKKLGFAVDVLPLSTYRHDSFCTMRTDSLDRFGTRLVHLFTKTQIEEMLTNAGLETIRFSEKIPFWCAVELKKA